MDQVLTAPYIAALDAVEYLRASIHTNDVPVLIHAFEKRKELTLKIEILDAIGLINSKEVCDFLEGVAKSRGYYLIRYYAIRNLIDLQCGNWKPSSKTTLRSDFYASLLAYSAYRRGDMTLDELQRLAHSRVTLSGDHWEWLTTLER